MQITAMITGAILLTVLSSAFGASIGALFGYFLGRNYVIQDVDEKEINKYENSNEMKQWLKDHNPDFKPKESSDDNFPRSFGVIKEMIQERKEKKDDGTKEKL